MLGGRLATLGSERLGLACYAASARSVTSEAALTPEP
jgi:hypothetical protein